MTMAFDLALIERALDQAVCDAEDALSERHRSYAGYPHVGKFALYEDAVRDAKAARAEFAALKASIAEAPCTLLRFMTGYIPGGLAKAGHDPDTCVRLLVWR